MLAFCLQRSSICGGDQNRHVPAECVARDPQTVGEDSQISRLPQGKRAIFLGDLIIIKTR